MGCKPDEWAKTWIEQKRREDPEMVKGWTIEKRGDTHYIKWGTTVWDKELKKYRKKSKHIGTLNPNGTITKVKPRSKEESNATMGSMPISVKEYGNAYLLEQASERIFEPLRSAFPEVWPELLAMAMMRLGGNARLNHLSDAWRLIDDTRGLKPRMSPDILSEILMSVGGQLDRQEEFYKAIDGEEGHYAVDLSVVFSKSEGVKMLRKGYNRFRLQGTQFNLSVICGMQSGMPCKLSTVCGNVKENSLVGMLKEFELPKDCVLIMDRGYCSVKIMADIVEASHDFIVAAKRNSKAYNEIRVGDGHFTWEGRAINYGTGRFGDYYAYRFEDLGLRSDEIFDKYKAEEEKQMEVRNLDRAGNVMIISSLNIHPREIYRMFKCRVTVENFFDTGKNSLEGDKTYLRTDLHVIGYNFVTFLAFCIWSEIRSWLEEAGIESRYTPGDLLRKFAAVKIYYMSTGMVMSDVPRDVRDLANTLNKELKVHTS